MADWLDDRILAFDPEVQRRLTRTIRQQFAAEDEALQAVHQRALAEGLPPISVRPEEGHMLHFLASLIGVRRILEIGTLAGYSGIWLARSLPAGGTLITLEQDPRHAAIAREHFALAGVADRVTVLEGAAQDTLARLDGGEPFDLLFIDADKESYPRYTEWGMRNVRPGGLILAHNAFRNGKLADADPDAATLAMRATLDMMATHPRLLATIIPVGDGLAAAQVR